jgi:hypothetical protein
MSQKLRTNDYKMIFYSFVLGVEIRLYIFIFLFGGGEMLMPSTMLVIMLVHQVLDQGGIMLVLDQ